VVGTEVEGNWRAMYPAQSGVVIEIDQIFNDVTIDWEVTDRDDFDNDVISQSVTDRDTIYQPCWTSVNGSSIGIFVTEEM
jgi:hypothetical protein